VTVLVQLSAVVSGCAERRFGLRADDPIGAVEVLHACKALKGLIWSQYLSARGEKARAKVHANLDNVRYADITYVINRIRSIQIESVLSIEDEY
jgi:hypothetical protein